MTGYARPELLASVDWLAENIHRPDLRILDVRWRPDGSARAVFGNGHLPKALHVDWAKELCDMEADTVLLADPDRLADLVERAGIGNESTVVIYDDTASLYASRAWWSLRAYGIESVRILDGGYQAWIDAGGPVSSAKEPEAMGVPKRRASLRVQPRVRLSTADIRALLGAPEVTILDSRSYAEYAGFQGSDKRLGHIPGALNVPIAATWEPGTQKLRPARELQRLMRVAGVPESSRFVCYDGSGIGASRLAFILMLLGHEDVAVYDGGWAEWGNRLELPVEH